MGKFWVNWIPAYPTRSANVPTMKHFTIDSVATEATRLAKETGHEVFILEAISSIRPVTTTESTQLLAVDPEDLPDFEVPF